MVPAKCGVAARIATNTPTPLFSHAGIHLPLKARPDFSLLQQRWRDPAALYLPSGAVNDNLCCHLSERPRYTQCQFYFMNKSADCPVYFVPKSQHLMLHYGIYDVLQDRPLLRQCGLKLEAQGILYIAHLVQLTKFELLQFRFIDSEIALLLESELAAFGLRLGSATPSWHGPSYVRPSRAIRNRAAIDRRPTI
jgi:hypothetical protein